MTREGIVKAEVLFDRWGIWVVAIGRMFAGVRGAMVVAAGATRFNFTKFVVADGLAALVSGGLFMGLGYWAGIKLGNIEQMPGWESCDTCSGGGQISYSMSLNYPQPGTTQFSIGRGDSWAHALWWKRLGNDASPSHFVLSLDQSLDNPDASFGIEYDANQIMGGEWYDFAIQCSFGYGIWQVWDDANQRWVPTSAPCARQAASSHVQLRLEFERSNGQAHFVSIGTNGAIVPLNMARANLVFVGAA